MHVDDSIDPIRDLETIQSELCKKDLDIVKKAKQAEELAVRKSGGKYKLSPIFNGVFDKMMDMLKDGNPVRNGEWSAAEIELINEKAVLITTKPIVYLANMTNEDYIRKKNKWLPKVHAWIQAHGGGPLVPFSIQFEKEIMVTPNPDVQSALPKMITLGYSQLNLIYFFTAGEKEVRAWTVYGILFIIFIFIGSWKSCTYCC